MLGLLFKFGLVLRHNGVKFRKGCIAFTVESVDLIGTFDAPAGRIALQGTNVAIQGSLSARQLALRAESGPDAASAMDASLDAKDVSTGTDRRSLARAVSATLKGTRAAHRVDFSAAMTANQSLRATFDGGLDSRAKSPQWSGNVQSLVVSGPTAFALSAPASLLVSEQRVELGEATLKAEFGEAHLAMTRWTALRRLPASA